MDKICVQSNKLIHNRYIIYGVTDYYTYDLFDIFHLLTVAFTDNKCDSKPYKVYSIN